MTSREAFGLLDDELHAHYYGNRTLASSLLAWFLEAVWHIEREDVENAICDGGGDKGIDGILVNEDLKEIAVFQSKHYSAEGRTQGEAALRQFRGVGVYFRGPEGIDRLLESAPNDELRQLVERMRLRELLEAAEYTVRLVFVTNAEPDRSALDFLGASVQDAIPMELWGRHRLASIAERSRKAELLEGEFRLGSTSPAIQEQLTDGTKIAFALVPAQVLVELQGIDDLTIFGPNVRLELGNTRINRELRSTIEHQEEHALFPAYHNGLTLLTNRLDIQVDTLVLIDIAVVNGCQSLRALYSRRASLTTELKLLVKVVQLGDDPELADRITYRTNNQNPVNIRDQRSNDRMQRRLQREIDEHYYERLYYAVRQGDKPVSESTPIMDNRVAAQLIMAIWLNEPWDAVRKLRLFDQEYHRVFSRIIDAHKIYLGYRLDELIEAHRSQLRPELQASFASIRFTLAFLVAEMVRQDDLGARLFEDPGKWLPDKEADVIGALEPFVDEAIDSTNFHVEQSVAEAESEGRTFDPKVVFKSRSGVQALARQVMVFSKRTAMKNPEDYYFSVEPQS